MSDRNRVTVSLILREAIAASPIGLLIIRRSVAMRGSRGL